MRITFLSHFTICLAFAAGAFFAVVNGVPQTIWANDQSMMTSVIAVLFVGSASYLGWLAWLADSSTLPADGGSVSADFGHLAERFPS